jgi:succinate dehydrogenase (ubiquinone) cytochrome b560 subunit
LGFLILIKQNNLNSAITMFSQKVAQQSLRRLAVQQPLAMRSSMMGASPVAVALGKNIQTRSVTQR